MPEELGLGTREIVIGKNCKAAGLVAELGNF